MEGRTLIAFFTSWNMWVTIVPIILCSVVSFAVIIERIVYYRKINHDYRLISETVLSQLRENNRDAAKGFCSEYPGPIVSMIEAIIDTKTQQEYEGVVLGNSRKAIVKIEKNVNVIATIATISPMLGLFGTVTGLLKAFVALYQGGPDASSMLAYGVSEALLTTIIGLMVAIPSWIFYNYMVSQVEFYIKEIEYIANVFAKVREA